MDIKLIDIGLIHGTWARDAEWTQPGSDLFTVLDEVTGDNGEVLPLPWTGRNRDKDRQRAAETTREIVDGSKADMQVLIGHSHGGNIGALALHRTKDDNVVQPKRALVTLNTPFLIPTPRSFQVKLFHRVLLALGIAFFIEDFLRPAFDWLPPIFASMVLLLVVPIILFLLPVLLFNLTLFVLMVFFRRSIGTARSYVSSLIELLSGQNSLDRTTRVLCISTADDEALGWLQIAESLLNLPFLLLHRFALPITVLALAVAHYAWQWDFSRAALWVVGTAEASLIEGTGLLTHIWTTLNEPAWFRDVPQEGISQLSQCVWGNVNMFGDRNCEDLGFPAPVLVFLSLPATFLSFWLTLAVGGLLGSYVLGAFFFGTGYGLKGLLFSLEMRLRVSPVPTQFGNVQLVTVDTDSSSWVRHSTIYTNERVLKIVRLWIMALELERIRNKHTSRATTA